MKRGKRIVFARPRRTKPFSRLEPKTIAFTMLQSAAWIRSSCSTWIRQIGVAPA